MRKPTVQKNETFSRPYAGYEDFKLVRQFLIDNWSCDKPGFTWDHRRWDGSYFHNEQPGFGEHWQDGKSIRIWEAPGTGIVAVMHPEGGGDAWFEVHPDFRHLEPEMLDWAEANIACRGKDGRLMLRTVVWDYDTTRQELLLERGYVKSDNGEVVRRFTEMGVPQPKFEPPEGYRLHSLKPGDSEDCERYAVLINAAFQRDSHSAQEVMTFTTQSPSFNPELELLVAAPDGAFIALAGMIYDEQNRFGLFEPVCAHPGPKPIGLTGNLMLEGVRRVQALGAKECYVGTGIGMAANRFYDAVGFEILHTGWQWVREME